MDPKTMYSRSNFFDFVKTAPAFNLVLTDDQIPIVNVVRSTADGEAEKYRGEPSTKGCFEHFKYLRKDIFIRRNYKLKFYTFNHVEAFFAHEKIKAKPLQTLFVKHDGRYLVKRFFTEGLQYVAENEVHVYEPEGRPLDVYFANDTFPADVAFKINSFHSSYSFHLQQTRIHPQIKLKLSPKTYYLVIAPCPTVFTKRILTENIADACSTDASSKSCLMKYQSNSSEIDAGSENGGLNGNEDGYPSDSRCDHLTMADDFKFHNSKKSLTKKLSEKYRSGFLSLNSNNSTTETEEPVCNEMGGSLDETLPNEALETDSPDNSLRNHESEEFNSHNCSRTKNPKRRKNCKELVTAVVGIREDSHIESYTILHGSTFNLQTNGTLTGSFAMENEDMDPHHIEYSVTGNMILEKAFFKNGSTFETPLLIKTDLMELLNETNRRREKVVVDYFFTSAFQNIEDIYRRFLEMRNTGMIGSCVPAIVQICGSRFTGVLPDAYKELKNLRDLS